MRKFVMVLLTVWMSVYWAGLGFEYVDCMITKRVVHLADNNN